MCYMLLVKLIEVACWQHLLFQDDKFAGFNSIGSQAENLAK